jgi:hypothetical protein
MMDLTRRKVLGGGPALPPLAVSLGVQTFAEAAPQVASDMPPILFVHGNGDHAELWITTL